MLIRVPFIRSSLSWYQKNRRLRGASSLFIATHCRVRVSPSEILNEGSGSTVIAGRKRRREGEEQGRKEGGGKRRNGEERKGEEGGGKGRKGEEGGGRGRKGREGGGRWRNGRRREG